MTPKVTKKRLMISTTVVSAALGVAAPTAAEASVVPNPCGKPPPFTSPSPSFCSAPPFADLKFFPRGQPQPAPCLTPRPFTPGFFPQPTCID